jgi:hypothetical protein
VTRTPQPPLTVTSRAARALLTLATLALALLAFAPAANASKQAVDFFGGNGTLGGQFNEPMSVAVNDSGAGPANAGDVYAIDSGSPSASGNRIQRFGRDDNGTPGTTPVATADDTYFFISAWGADVSLPAGGSDYEICTVAAECQAGVASGGNGTAAGNGALDFTSFDAGAIAVDQDTGNVFVTDTDNFRVNVYDGVGAFLYSFGFDVTASGPGNTGTGFEICVAGDDVCKAGVSGSGTGQLGAGSGGSAGTRGIAVSAPDGNPGTGTVFLADSANQRVNTYSLDGSSPASIGSAAQFDSGWPRHVAVDSRGILYAASSFSTIQRYDTLNANGGGVGFLAPIAPGVDERQRLTVSATAGTFRLSFDPDGAGPAPTDTTPDLPFNASATAVQDALRALPSIGSTGLSFVSGGPGDATGSNPYTIPFELALGAKDVPQIVASDGSVPLSGGSGASVATTVAGQPGLAGFARSLAVDPDSDGPGGADADVLYPGRLRVIQQYGPLNAPGLTAPPTVDDDRHGTNGVYGDNAPGLAAEPATGRLYVASSGSAGRGIYVIDNTGPPPTASLDSCDNVTATSAECHATIDPNGPPATRYHFEYSTDGSSWLGLPEEFLGVQTDPQAIDRTVSPAPIGLSPNTLYHVRLVAGRKFADPLITNELTFTTDPAPPLAETAGAPVRTTTTAQINGRVIPRNSATSYRFEYGDGGPCSANPCTPTPSAAAGSDDLAKLVAEEITGLQPDTTYHYRLVADNGVGGEVSGGDMTVRTRATDVLPNQSDEFPGPPGSDRAWEMVSIAESSGNPIGAFFLDAFSDDGNRAVYGIAGGTPIAPSGSFLSPYFAERTEAGWQTRPLLPPRDQLVGPTWDPYVYGAKDLSTMATALQGSDSGVLEGQLWRFTPGAGTTLLHHQSGAVGGTFPLGISADGTRVVGNIGAGFYDLGTATPPLLSLLPGEVAGPCGVSGLSSSQAGDSNWVSADGSLVYFHASPSTPCAGTPAQLYVRDTGAAQTSLVSGPPLSGPDCAGALVKATPGAAFFTTSSRLDPDDTAPGACTTGNDIYRYDTSDDSLECLTCIAPGFHTQVSGDSPSSIGVAEDGSRVYFAAQRLVPGAQGGAYRLDVASGEIAYVGPVNVGTAQPSVALSADGSILVFASDEPSLNPLGGTSDNDSGTQYYRYDDTDRSIVCVSCPQDGSPPLEELSGSLHKITGGGFLNNRALSADGTTLAFVTTTPLAGADQNTPSGGDLLPGTDVYEWRDGRHILVTDGLTRWLVAPLVEGVNSSGRDIYFDAAAAYTPDAPDALFRLYTARIGGGIEFPPPGLPPCDLNAGACEGPGSSAPDLPGAGSAAFEGQGDPIDPFPRDCSAASERAAKLSRLAGALRESARHADPGRAEALRRKAAKLSRQAKNARGDVRSCRRANRGVRR